ncbi:hypothetical protein [Microbulbifer sp. GL-2]|uniref:hypothetical protein n=1 Tax=Microbulbifer sp. GL-2 TaxID=2591606 RepID=UPI00117D6298|nr:hypothetical protein [Microbulbifer sp. GL-2]
MKRLLDSLQTARIELYSPRKRGVTVQIIPRRNPMVYGDSRPHTHLELTEINIYRKQSRTGSVITVSESDELHSIFHIHESGPLFTKLYSDNRLASIGTYILVDAVYLASGKPGSSVALDCGSNGKTSLDPRFNLFFNFNPLSNTVRIPFCDLP